MSRDLGRDRGTVPDPGHWLLVATEFNVIRILALGFTVGLVTRARMTRQDRHRPAARGGKHQS